MNAKQKEAFKYNLSAVIVVLTFLTAFVGLCLMGVAWGWGLALLIGGAIGCGASGAYNLALDS